MLEPCLSSGLCSSLLACKASLTADHPCSALEVSDPTSGGSRPLVLARPNITTSGASSWAAAAHDQREEFRDQGRHEVASRVTVGIARNQPHKAQVI